MSDLVAFALQREPVLVAEIRERLAREAEAVAELRTIRRAMKTLGLHTPPPSTGEPG